jgi:hypothetical protein
MTLRPSPLRHPLSQRADDCYETPPEAVQALLRNERIPHDVWEPACGPGAFVRELRAVGHRVIATDLVDYGCPDSKSRIDFLMESRAPQGVLCIVTNPPFKLAARFVEHALALCPRVIMLLPLTFIAGERHATPNIFDQLARIHVFKHRLPMMHRRGWDGPKSSNQKDHAWFVWERGHVGPALTDRISWKLETT